MAQSTTGTSLQTHDSGVLVRDSASLQFLLSLSDELRSLPHTEAIQGVACRSLGEFLGVTRVAYAETEGDEYVVRQRWAGADLSRAERGRVQDWGESLIALYKRGEPVAIADVENEKRIGSAQLEIFRRLKIRSFLGLPLVKNGTWVATLLIGDSLQRVWTTEAIQLSRDVAERVWLAAEHARAEAAHLRSEQRLRRVLETDAVGVLFFNSDGYIVDANDVFLRMTGYSRGGVQSGKVHWRDWTPPEWIAESERQMARFQTTGRVGPYEKEYFVKDGSRRWMLFAGRDLGDGTIAEYAIDITDRHKAEAALEESEQRFRHLVESYAQAVWEADAEGRIVADSPSWRAYTGQTAEEFMGSGWAEAIHPDDREDAQRQWRDALAAEKAASAEFRLRWIGGGWRWTNVRATPIRDTNGQIVKWVGLNVDIDDRKRAEAELRESEQRQSYLLRLSDAIGSLLDPAEVKLAASKILGQQLSVAAAGYMELDASQEIAFAVGGYNNGAMPSFEGTYQVTDFGEFAQVALSGDPLFVDDFMSDPRGPSGGLLVAEAMKMRSVGLVPLIKGGRLVAFLYAAHPEPRQWSVNDQRILAETAERTWSAVERARTEAALREREAQLAILDEIAKATQRGLTDDEIMRTVGAKIGAYLKVPNFIFSEVDPERREITDRTGWQESGMPPLIGTTHKISSFFTEEFDRLAKAGKVIVVTDAQNDPISNGEAYRALDIRSFFCIPFLINGQWKYLMSVADRKPRQWKSSEVTLLREFGARLSFRTERTKAEASVRASEARQNFLLRLADTLRPLRGPAEIQSAASRLLGEQIQADRAFYSEVSADEEEITIHRDYHRSNIPSAAGTRRIGVFGYRERDILRKGQAVVNADLLNDPELSTEARSALAAGYVGAWIMVPLVKGERWDAAFSVHSQTPRRWTNEEIELVEETAQRTWAALERARAETALRESEHRYRSLFESMGEGVATISLIRNDQGDIVDYSLLSINPAGLRISSVTNEQIGGVTGSQLSPGDHQFWLSVFQRAVESREPVSVEHFAPRLGRWLDVTVQYQGSDRIISLYADITERRRSQEALARSEARQAYLLRLSDAVGTLADPLEIQSEAARVLATEMQADRAFYSSLNRDNTVITIERDYHAPDLGSMVGVYRLEDFSTTPREIMRRGMSVIVKDVETDTRFTEAQRQAYQSVNGRAWIAAPLIKEGRLVATLNVYSRTAREWSLNEVELLEETAERTWAVVERALAEKAVRESEEVQAFLLNLSDTLRSLADSREIRIRAARVLGEYLGANRAGYAECEADGNTVVLRDQFVNGVRTLRGRFKLTDFGQDLFTQLHSGKNVLYSDVSRDPRFSAEEHAAYSALPIVANASIPLVKNGQLVAILFVHYTEPHEFTRREVWIMEAVAERTWAAVERARAEDLTRRSLEEKEALLKEVHHRVKNNLQVITSLLSLQAREIDDPRTLSLFDETRNRVHSIAAIHEHIYRSSSFAAIDLLEYAGRLSRDLVQFYGLGNRVKLHVEGEAIYLALERAVPFGLMLNELVSNACRHAFPDARSGAVRVELSKSENNLTLVVRDDGVGLPPDFENRKSASLGLQLVAGLALQLKGTVEFATDRGAKVTVAMPADEQ